MGACGVDQHELRALVRITKLVPKGTRDASPCLIGLDAWGPAERVIPELAGPSRAWVSHTPFCPPRHRKRKQSESDYWTDEICRELHHRGWRAEELRVDRLPAADLPAPPLAYRRHRLSERLPDERRAAGLRLEFSQPLTGPLALGALSHFGLGLFLPERSLKRG